MCFLFVCFCWFFFFFFLVLFSCLWSIAYTFTNSKQITTKNRIKVYLEIHSYASSPSQYARVGQDVVLLHGRQKVLGRLAQKRFVYLRHGAWPGARAGSVMRCTLLRQSQPQPRESGRETALVVVGSVSVGWESGDGGGRGGREGGGRKEKLTWKSHVRSPFWGERKGGWGRGSYARVGGVTHTQRAHTHT